jgi:hypothetical protein
MPNLCGNFIQDAGGRLSEKDEYALVWAALTMLGGGLDTVCLLIAFNKSLTYPSLEYIIGALFYDGYDSESWSAEKSSCRTRCRRG